MLEILLLIGLTRKIGTVVEAKGKPSGRYKVLAVVLWIGGEIMGMIIGTLAQLDTGAYLLALLGAAAGAGIAYYIAKSVAPAQKLPNVNVFD